MITAFIYRVIYLLVVAILTIIVASQYRTVGNRVGNRGVYGSFFLAIVLALFIGFRPLSTAFPDMASYSAVYESLAGSYFQFSWDTENFLFDNLLGFFASGQLTDTLFFVVIALIYFVCIFYASKKLFPNDTMLAFIVYLGAFSTFSYATNGIKAGAAAALFLVAIAYHEKRVLSFLFLFLSLGFHHSMIVPIAAYLAAMFYKNPKVYLYVWLACFLMAALHITFFQNLFGGMADEQGAGYLMNQTEKVVSGFRPDFILYSAIPIFIGYNLMSKKRIVSKEYSFIWSVYVLANCVFLLCTYANFINRIAYLSWLMYPFVLLYPFVKVRWSRMQDNYFKYIVYGHLAFTLFMDFIYYGI